MDDAKEIAPQQSLPVEMAVSDAAVPPAPHETLTQAAASIRSRHKIRNQNSQADRGRRGAMDSATDHRSECQCTLRPRTAALGLLGVACWIICAASAAADWPPVSTEELQMQDEPKAPGAQAIILYIQIDQSDEEHREDVYERIKILTDEGRGAGDIHLPFYRNRTAIRDIAARVIHPDGRIVTFDGTVYEKVIAESKDIDSREKTFTLPDVEPGCIVEVRYRQTFSSYWVFNSQWILSQKFFVRSAKFSLLPSRQLTLRWGWPNGLPEGASRPTQDRPYGIISMEAHDLAPFVSEEWAPPENQLKYRVEFIYSQEHKPESVPATYWSNLVKQENPWVTAFMNSPHAMAQAVAQIISPSDSADTKLHKLFVRAQQMQNLTFMPDSPERAEKLEHDRYLHNVEDVWTAGYGTQLQITYLFLALTRAAGFNADYVIASKRDDVFFDERLMAPARLVIPLVMVHLEGQDLYLDPGEPYLGFGEIGWTATGVKALRFDANGGSWVTTPAMHASQSAVARNATLTLDDSGALTGTVTATFTGEEALWRRDRERHEDPASRTKFIEEDLRDDLGPGSQVTLTNQPEWSGAGTPLLAEFKVEIPDWSTAAGHRQFFHSGVMVPHAQKTMFKESRKRIHPIYFHYPYKDRDTITVALPSGWHADQLPHSRALHNGVLLFASSATTDGHTLTLTREFSLDAMILSADSYEAVREFFDAVRASDDDQSILDTHEPAARP
jgi:hypothetical protein